eukprot:TRINITY_DN24479_c0_g1_i1.p1 TRINITY_DN24479_c0_g1~~TRINITY_DN24479_c0_g1_i1.p1  ORF type:complete len:211 (+),score=32.49 TRINITY_DN24479_c0_g1_i1:88-720(+)
MSHSHAEGEACQCVARAAPVQQTLDEMDWDRGIWCAVVEGNMRKVQQFLSSNSSWLEERDTAGYTALQYAVSNGNVEIINFLLSKKVFINTQTNTGRTPLHKAAVKGNSNILKILLDNGADPTIVDNEGRLPIHEAADAACLEMLSSSGPAATTPISPPVVEPTVEAKPCVAPIPDPPCVPVTTDLQPSTPQPTTSRPKLGNVFSLKKRK